MQRKLCRNRDKRAPWKATKADQRNNADALKKYVLEEQTTPRKNDNISDVATIGTSRMLVSDRCKHMEQMLDKTNQCDEVDASTKPSEKTKTKTSSYKRRSSTKMQIPPYSPFSDDETDAYFVQTTWDTHDIANKVNKGKTHKKQDRQKWIPERLRIFRFLIDALQCDDEMKSKMKEEIPLWSWRGIGNLPTTILNKLWMQAAEIARAKIFRKDLRRKFKEPPLRFEDWEDADLDDNDSDYDNFRQLFEKSDRCHRESLFARYYDNEFSYEAVFYGGRLFGDDTLFSDDD